MELEEEGRMSCLWSWSSRVGPENKQAEELEAAKKKISGLEGKLKGLSEKRQELKE